MLTKSALSIEQLRARVRWFGLGAAILLVLTAYSLVRVYNGAHASQAQIALAMRQVSEVTWRVKSLEMWTRMSQRELQVELGNPGNSQLLKTSAFGLSDGQALKSLSYLDRVVNSEAIAALDRILTVLQRVQIEGAPYGSDQLNVFDSALQDAAILVKEAGNLNFEAVAELLTNSRRKLLQDFAVATAISMISILIALALWRTERNLTGKLSEAHKSQLETLGALSSGFAHMTQNILWSLRESLTSVASIRSLKAGDRNQIERALTEIKSLNALNTSLTKAAHDPSKDDEIRPLGDVVAHIEPMLGETSGGIEVNVEPAAANVSVPFATSVFVISELLNNALDAIRESKRGKVVLTIKLARKGVTIEVTDTGLGMSPTVQENCLSPFFSTKSESAGHCGFGLHSIDRLVSGLGGTLEVQSQERSGTRVFVTIP